MAITYLKKAIKTPTTDESKTKEAVQHILNDIEKEEKKVLKRLQKNLINTKVK